ncbi:TRM11 family SAM-dependent methyltransferase [Clostridium sp.]|uniref:TRM11 family SAM-dependent methyltransferase n=1 Tax=Clostridium sp. TaxID=1506 RepID=UPI002FCC805B
MIKEKGNGYFYVLNYPEYEEELCKLEMRRLFKVNIENKYLVSKVKINPTRSPFIKECIEIMYDTESLEKLISCIKNDLTEFDSFKVNFIRLKKNEATYSERLSAMKEIGVAIKGTVNIHNANTILGVIKIEGRWIFGIYKKNDCKWHEHDNKPFSYSNALSVRVARALINIAVGDNLNKRVLDPCCGVGTVVIEGLSMGIDIVGYEINPQIACNGKGNLKAFGYESRIIKGDMREIKDKYDACIVDLPYGLFTKTTREEQIGIIKASRTIAKEVIIISSEDMDDFIVNEGFNIIDRGYVTKNNFKRFISVCK